MPIHLARLLGFILAAALLLAATPAAFAHAQLLSTSPVANAVLPAAPARVDLAFNEPVSTLAVTLIGPDGSRTDLLDQARSDGTDIVIDLPEALPGGSHVLSWRVVSVDAHPIAGSLVFSIGAASESAMADLPLSSRATSMALWASKAVLFAALFFGAGGAIFAIAAPLPAPARRIAMLLSGLGLVVAPLSLGLHGLDALGLAPDAILSVRPWQVGLSTSYGSTTIVATLAFALALLALRWAPARPVLWAVWLLAAVALSLSGHAGAAEPQWLTRPAVSLHIAGILFWIGALLPLLFLLRSPGAASDWALAQFSRFIPLAVLAILVSGATLAVIQLGPPGQAWFAPYGQILAAKLALLVILFAIALHNRLRLTQPALAGQPMARYRLRQSIAVEIAIVLAILALVSLWRFTPPPRALAQVAAATAVAAEPLYTHGMDEQTMVSIAITPGQVGPVLFELYLADAEGEEIVPLGVALTLSSPALGIEPFKADARFADGAWLIDQTIPVAGTWLADIEIRLSRFSLSHLQTEFDIPSP